MGEGWLRDGSAIAAWLSCKRMGAAEQAWAFCRARQERDVASWSRADLANSAGERELVD